MQIFKSNTKSAAILIIVLLMASVMLMVMPATSPGYWTPRREHCWFARRFDSAPGRRNSRRVIHILIPHQLQAKPHRYRAAFARQPLLSASNPRGKILSKCVSCDFHEARRNNGHCWSIVQLLRRHNSMV